MPHQNGNITRRLDQAPNRAKRFEDPRPKIILPERKLALGRTLLSIDPDLLTRVTSNHLGRMTRIYDRHVPFVFADRTGSGADDRPPIDLDMLREGYSNIVPTTRESIPGSGRFVVRNANTRDRILGKVSLVFPRRLPYNFQLYEEYDQLQKVADVPLVPARDLAVPLTAIHNLDGQLSSDLRAVFSRVEMVDVQFGPLCVDEAFVNHRVRLPDSAPLA